MLLDAQTEQHTHRTSSVAFVFERRTGPGLGTFGQEGELIYVTDPRLRAVGWSVVLCELRADRLVELGTISGMLPPGSTVPQGEAFAIIQAHPSHGWQF